MKLLEEGIPVVDGDWGLLNFRTRLSKNSRVSRTHRQDRSVDHAKSVICSQEQEGIRNRADQEEERRKYPLRYLPEEKVAGGCRPEPSSK